MNDRVAKGMDDLINTIRPRWVAQQHGLDPSVKSLERDLTVDGAGPVSFLVLGDPGEQDGSQYAVVEPMLARADGTAFMLIASDVIYPAGDINDYIDGFYLPYENYKKPIYAIPGNHDWYDGLNGFMWHFCRADALPPVAYRSGSFSWKERLARSIWRKPAPPKLPQLLHERAKLEPERREASQPGPYFTIKTKGLLIVCIDTGITGKLDRQQGEWLRSVSCEPGPKLLVTGKPIYADGAYHPGEIDWGPENDDEIGADVEARGCKTVDDIVRMKRHDYRAVIGGDVHNYQSYSVEVIDRDPDDCRHEYTTRTIHYLVSGGAGAYLSATHRFAQVDLQPEVDGKPIPVERITEDDFRCYTLRGDSLTRFVRRSSVGFAITILATVGVLVSAPLLFVLPPFNGVDQRVTELGGVELWKAMATVPGAMAAAIGALFAATRLSNWAVPLGYRTMTSTVLTGSIGALIVAGASALLNEEWHEFIWRMAVTSLLGLLLPAAALVGYFLLRDFIAPSVRAAVALAIPLGLLIAAVKIEDEVALDVVAAPARPLDGNHGPRAPAEGRRHGGHQAIALRTPRDPGAGDGRAGDPPLGSARRPTDPSSISLCMRCRQRARWSSSTSP